MRVIGSLHDRVRLAVLTTALLGVACSPGPTPAPRPVTRTPQLVPAPVSISYPAGAPFTLLRTTSIVVDAGNAETAAIGEMLGALLRPPTGYAINVISGPSTSGAIALRLADNPSLGDEGYQLTVTADSVRVVARRPAGLFY